MTNPDAPQREPRRGEKWKKNSFPFPTIVEVVSYSTVYIHVVYNRTRHAILREEFLRDYQFYAESK